jgi:hypothetical protein
MSVAPLIQPYGVQPSYIEKNDLATRNAGATLTRFKDAITAAHRSKNNQLKQSGSIGTN